MMKSFMFLQPNYLHSAYPTNQKTKRISCQLIHIIKFQFVSNSWFEFNTCKINTKQKIIIETNKQINDETIHVSATKLLTAVLPVTVQLVNTTLPPSTLNAPPCHRKWQCFIHIIKFQCVSNSWFKFNTCKINTKRRNNYRNKQTNKWWNHSCFCTKTTYILFIQQTKKTNAYHANSFI